jgi:hypothetical protein
MAARNAEGPLQTSSSRSVERLPLGGRSSCGSTRWSTRERQLAGSPVQPRAYAVAAHLRQAIPPLSSYGSFGRAMASTPPGGRCSCRTQCATRDSPAQTVVQQLLSAEWPVHRKLIGATRDHQVAGSAAGCSAPPGNVRPPVQPRVYAVAVSPSGRDHRGPRAHAMAARHWQVGELTLPGYGAQGGAPRAGLTGRAQQVPTSPSRTSSIRRAGSAVGPQRCRQAGVLMPWAQAGGAAMVAGSSTPTAAARGPRGGEPSPPATGPDSACSARNFSGTRRPPSHWQLRPPHCLTASHT